MEILVSLPTKKGYKRAKISLSLVYTGFPQVLTDVKKRGKTGTKNSHRKMNWDTQAVIFTTYKKVDMAGLKLPQFTQSS